MKYNLKTLICAAIASIGIMMAGTSLAQAYEPPYCYECNYTMKIEITAKNSSTGEQVIFTADYEPREYFDEDAQSEIYMRYGFAWDLVAWKEL